MIPNYRAGGDGGTARLPRGGNLWPSAPQHGRWRLDVKDSV